MYIGNPPVVNASRLVYEAYATQDQTVITPPGGYTVGQLEVLINGNNLSGDDYTATDGSTITLAQKMGLNDTIKVIAYGTFAVASTYSQAQIDAKVATVNANIANVGPSFKNKLINGAMVIDQRNNGSSISPSSGSTYYPVDRFPTEWQGSQSGVTFQQVSDAPVGFSKSIKLTVGTGAAVGSTDYLDIQHHIEGLNLVDMGFGSVNAKTFTCSFWVKTSIAGTYGISFFNGTRAYYTTFTVSSANTWEQKSVTVAGDQTGSWAIDNTAGLCIGWFAGAGAGRQNATINSWTSGSYAVASGITNTIMSTSGATFQLAGVQFEKGSIATAFDYRSHQQELAMCHRYCYVPAQGVLSMAAAYSATRFDAYSAFPVPMRATPSATIASGSSYYRVYLGGVSSAFSNPLVNGINQNGVLLYSPSVSGLSAGAGGWLETLNAPGAPIIYSAEI